MASVSSSFGPVTDWSRLGIYRLLTAFPLDPLSASAMHPGLLTLAAQEDSNALVRTLEVYLDSGCNAKSAAAALFLHRGTLYYRLRRISEVTGTDLNSGDERLALHLSLKLGRLTGLITSEPKPL